MNLKWLNLFWLILFLGCENPETPSQIIYLGKVNYNGLLDREVSVYLPPNYDKNNTKGYPVIYANDGQNLFDKKTSAWNKEWRIDEVLDSLIRKEIVEPAIVVGIWSTAERTIDYAPNRPFQNLNDSVKSYYQKIRFKDSLATPKSDLYLQLITKSIKAKIDSLYKTNATC